MAKLPKRAGRRAGGMNRSVAAGTGEVRAADRRRLLSPVLVVRVHTSRRQHRTQWDQSGAGRMAVDTRGLVAVLRAVLTLLDRPGTDVTWSRYAHPTDAITDVT